MQVVRIFTVASVAGLLGACAAQAPDDQEQAPVAEDDTLDPAQTITNGAYTATANTPNAAIQNSIRASATFTGPAARRMGVCLLRMTATACNTVADCGSAPASLPAGGFRYCTNPGGSGQKYCAYRPGSQTALCAGTPANGGIPINPGALTTANVGIPIESTSYVSYACFEGCAVSDPSVSSAGRSVSYCKVYDVPAGCAAQYGVDVNCDGSVNYYQGGAGIIKC
jgi:hypothetical protein